MVRPALTPNPFAVTRAMDFTDVQIVHQWVDLPSSGGGFRTLAKPDSAMPMILVGGKGSGKTHLMRYLSTAVQLSSGRSAPDILSDGVLGIYVRGGGLNASRFSGKGFSADTWFSLFQFYFDLTLAEACIRTVRDVLDIVGRNPQDEALACRQILGLFDREIGDADSFQSLLARIAQTRRAIDMAVNNCAITRELPVSIYATPGTLVSGVPRCIAQHMPLLSKTLFVYLFDELENLNEMQQVHVNSLVRENEPPCSIKVGARLYGLRTTLTLSAGEEVKEGSEYELVLLDDHFRAMGDKTYREFAADLCLQRVRTAGLAIPVAASREWLSAQFEPEASSALGDTETAHVKQAAERPWLERLRANLLDAARRGWIDAEDVARVVETISCADHPLVERVSIHVLYQEWTKRSGIVVASERIAEARRRFLEGEQGTFQQSFEHWRGDMLAQILRDTQRPQRYAGWDTLVRLSHGFPRHLLVLMKLVWDWSEFRGERPLAGGTISLESQRLGVRDATEWFFRDARMAGEEGDALIGSVSKLGELLRAVRYAEKPSEVSVCAVSIDASSLPPASRRMLELAQKWSLLTAIDGGRPDKNSMRVDMKLQLHPLLCPRWSLPIARRGVLNLTTAEAVAVFEGGRDGDFGRVVAQKTLRMNGPFSAKGRSDAQSLLFDDGDE